MHTQPEEDLVFMLLDTTHDGPTINLYGVTMGGQSVRLTIHDFKPYLYVPAPPLPSDGTSAADFDRQFTQALDSEIDIEKLSTLQKRQYGPKPVIGTS
eukprot:SAG22_NODE_1491_length_4306_cov_16.877823_2_plen_98_part_00